MRDDVKAFAELVARVFDPPAPVLEIGSLQTPGQEGYADLRAAFAGKAYVGCDLVSGPGVDRIEDVHALDLSDASVGTVLALDSLEHVADPRVAVGEMHRVLRPNGLCVIAMPFVFPIHHQPDFHRFTPEGMALLLAPFPVRQVCSAGDAQWPHTVFALATPGVSRDAATAFGERAARLLDAWERAARFDPFLPFVPVTGVVRRDTGEARLEALAEGRSLTQRLEVSAPGLCRIDVKLDGRGEPAGRDVVLTLGPADRPDTILRRAVRRVRAPWPQRWIAFAFAPLDAGGAFFFRLDAPDAARGTTVSACVAPDGTLSFEAFVRRAETPPPPVPRARGAQPPGADGLQARLRRLLRASRSGS
jgi:SAM-dependent methyltransferase